MDSDSELDDVVAAMALLIARRRAQNVRRFGVHEINQQRKRVGQFHALFGALRRDEKEFRKYTRMSVAVFDKLLSLVEQRLKKRSRREPILPAERLIVCLRFLSQGDSFRAIGVNFCMGDNTVGRIVRETCSAIVAELAPRYLTLPSTPDEWQRIADSFWERWNIPNTCGAIDGKHVRMKAPANSGTLYHNYKGYFSTAMMAVSDANYRIIYASFGSYGHENDAGIFDRCDFGRMVKSDANPLNLPAPAPLPGTNREISRARRVVESAFGILTQRWRILLRPIETTPETCDTIVKALACLHNFLLEEGAVAVPQPDEHGDIPDPGETLPQAPIRHNNANRAANDANDVQNLLVEFFNGPGALDWQREHLGL